MKYSLLGFSVLVLLALGGCRSPFGPSTHSSKTIWFETHDGLGGGGSGETIPAIDGYSSKDGDEGGTIGTSNFEIHRSVQVEASSPGHLVVQIHFTIDFDGVTTVVDKTVPVYDTKPTSDKWTRLDSHFLVSAYLGGGPSLPFMPPMLPPPSPPK